PGAAGLADTAAICGLSAGQSRPRVALGDQPRPDRADLVVRPPPHMGLYPPRRERGGGQRGAAGGGRVRESAGRRSATGRNRRAGREAVDVVAAVSALPRGAEETAHAGHLGGVLFAGGVAVIRTGPVADSGGGGRPAALRLLAAGAVRRQRPGVAA